MATQPVILVAPVFSTLANLGFQLRRTVFVLEQKVPAEEEVDADDLTAIHMVALMEGEVAGVLRIVRRPEHLKIGRVAVDSAFRGRGIAGAMMSRVLEDYSGEVGGRFFLTAQTDKVGLYERFGFKVFGQEFMDAGIPHLAMKTY
ncbi:GNAT family N-acetyltransferase [Rhizobium sp. FKL33]|uniref:GNAT family N-acetyltransferase n=1 Tax=Rhizobium sp. FKL33 TaxID=2562307 RepID=UPI0010C0BFCC|nr:GNAT family N-acetyltransferase [Rhizobium sp. FKL33]